MLIASSLHQRRELGAIFLHHLHRRFHLALAALLAAFYLFADLLEKFRILLDERDHHLALRLRHILQFVLRVLIEKKALYRHGGYVRLGKFCALCAQYSTSLPHRRPRHRPEEPARRVDMMRELVADEGAVGGEAEGGGLVVERAGACG